MCWVWEDQSIQHKHSNLSAGLDTAFAWTQADTVLIDDSMEKAASEPYNLFELEEYEGKDEQTNVDVLGQVVAYLENLRWQKDVSAYIRSEPFSFDNATSFDWTPFIDKIAA